MDFKNFDFTPKIPKYRLPDMNKVSDDFQKNAEIKRKKDNFRFWLPFGTSLVALAVAFCSLLLQLNSSQKPQPTLKPLNTMQKTLRLDSVKKK